MNRCIDQIMNYDIILYLCRYMNNRLKIRYLSVSKAMHQLKSKVAFKQRVNLCVIEELFYFDQFEYVVAHERFRILPKNTKILQFTKHFNESIYNLVYPSNLRHILFGSHFCQAIDGCIPDTVKYLLFGKRFNRPIDNLLPQSVTHLVLGEHFYEPFEKLPSLEYLTCIGYVFSWSFRRIYPEYLQYLEINSFTSPLTAGGIPECVKYLKIVIGQPQSYALPKSLVHLDICAALNILPINFVPAGVKYLILRGLGIKISQYVPIGVERLSLFIKNCDVEDLFERLPLSVRRLDLIPMLHHQVRPEHYRSGLRIKKIHSGVKNKKSLL